MSILIEVSMLLPASLDSVFDSVFNIDSVNAETQVILEEDFKFKLLHFLF